MNMRMPLLFIVFAVFLAGCAPLKIVTLATDIVKKSTGNNAEGPRHKVGDPYVIKGKTYYPKRDLKYKETGIASWYGHDFKGRKTANGEIFDPGKVSAAHRTLPMPSVVQVTNLENGKSIAVRINDRGPFARSRIIDLSEEAARLLGFREQGVAKVRVEILAGPSIELEKAAKEGRFPEIVSRVPDELPEYTPAKPARVSLSTTRKAAAAEAVPDDAAGDTAVGGTAAVSAVNTLKSNRENKVAQLRPEPKDIWIQVGSYGSRDNAKQAVEGIDHAWPLRVARVQTQAGQIFYRVRVGPLEKYGAADAMLSRLHTLGYNDARILLLDEK